MWILQLNSIFDRAESRDLLFRAETREELVAFVQRERVELYEDVGPGGYGHEGDKEHTFTKNFRKKGPLENFNPPVSVDDPSCYVDVRTLEDHLKEAEMVTRERWSSTILSVSPVPN